MNKRDYYRLPTIDNERVVFICGDDLWSVSLDDEVPSRLTANQDAAHGPMFLSSTFLTSINRDRTSLYLPASLKTDTLYSRIPFSRRSGERRGDEMPNPIRLVRCAG